MRVTQMSIVMASLSLAAAVMLYLKVDRLEDDLKSARATSREWRGAEVRAGSEAAGFDLPPRVVEAGPRATGGDALEPAGSGGGTAGARPAGTIEDRIARLEEQQKSLQAREGVAWRGPSQHFARNVDDLARHLTLTPTQRSRIEDVIARGRQRIEDVLKIPDETGKSPYERRTEARQKLQEAMKNPQPGGVLAFAADLASYHERKIPGRNDTYGGEIGRIQKEAREEIAGALDATQKEAFAQTNVDGLLGEAGQVSFAYAIGDAGDAAAPGLVIEMESSVSTDEAPAQGSEEPAAGNR